MVITRLFRSNKTQALRLPQEVAFPADTEVVVTVDGRARIVTPVDHAWDHWFDVARAADGDFPPREQPDAQERESW